MSDGIDPVFNFRPVYFKSVSNSLKKQNNSNNSDTEASAAHTSNSQGSSGSEISPEIGKVDNSTLLDSNQLQNFDASQSLKKMQRNFIEIMRIMHPQDPDSPK
jgi:hypothetical protein